MVEKRVTEPINHTVVVTKETLQLVNLLIEVGQFLQTNKFIFFVCDILFWNYTDCISQSETKNQSVDFLWLTSSICLAGAPLSRSSSTRCISSSMWYSVIRAAKKTPPTSRVTSWLLFITEEEVEMKWTETTKKRNFKKHFMLCKKWRHRGKTLLHSGKCRIQFLSTRPATSHSFVSWSAEKLPGNFSDN